MRSYIIEAWDFGEVWAYKEKINPDLWLITTRKDPESLRTVYVLVMYKRKQMN